MVMGDTRIEALDNSLFDKLQVFDGDISPMLEPDNNAIAIAVSLDDYGNLPNPEYYPKVGDTIKNDKHCACQQQKGCVYHNR